MDRRGELADWWRATFRRRRVPGRRPRVIPFGTRQIDDRLVSSHDDYGWTLPRTSAQK